MRRRAPGRYTGARGGTGLVFERTSAWLRSPGCWRVHPGDRKSRLHAARAALSRTMNEKDKNGMKTEKNARHLTTEQILPPRDDHSLDPEAGASLEACAACGAEVDQWTEIAAGVHQVWMRVEPPPGCRSPLCWRRREGPGGGSRSGCGASLDLAPRRRLVAASTADRPWSRRRRLVRVAGPGGAAHTRARRSRPPVRPPAAQRVVLDSVQETMAQSFDATFSFSETTSYGPYGQAPTTVTLPIDIQAESSAREQTTVIGTVAGTPVDVVAISYDGSAYEFHRRREAPSRPSPLVGQPVRHPERAAAAAVGGQRQRRRALGRPAGWPSRSTTPSSTRPRSRRSSTSLLPEVSTPGTERPERGDHQRARPWT